MHPDRGKRRGADGNIDFRPMSAIETRALTEIAYATLSKDLKLWLESAWCASRRAFAGRLPPHMRDKLPWSRGAALPGAWNRYAIETAGIADKRSRWRGRRPSATPRRSFSFL